MKKINRIFALALLGGATLFTSCVSEEVSPEVEKLRQAQVSYLQAQAAMEQAQAEAAAVQTALLQLELEYQQAMQASEIEGAIADIEAQVMQAQQKAAAAQLALQQAIDNLSGHINDVAVEYLDAYKTATGEADAKLTDILQQEGDIARFKAYLDENGNPLDFDLMAEAIQRDLAQDSATYKAQEASLAILKNVDADPASAEAELAEVTKQLEQLDQDVSEKLLERNKAQDTYIQAWEAYSAAEETIANRETYEQNLEGAKENIEALEAEIADLNEQIASVEGRLEPFEEEMAEQEAAYEPALAEAETLLEDWIQAEAALAAAAVNNGPGDEEYDNAKDAYDAARADFEAYAGDYFAAYGYGNPRSINLEEDAGIAGSDFGDVKIAYDAIADSFRPYGTAYQLQNQLASLEGQLEDRNSDLENQQNWKENIEDQINRTSEEYNTAVENLDQLEADAKAVYEVYYAVNQEHTELVERYSSLYSLEMNLRSYLNGTIASLTNRIENLEGQMLNTKEAISDNLAALEDNAISQSEWEAKIAQEEAKLERLNEEYEALLALAADYLEQFNQAVAN